MARRPRTAAQIAASRRNIIKAQRRSADLRRGRSQTQGTKAGITNRKFYAGTAGKPRRRTQIKRRAAQANARDHAADAIQTAKNAVALGSVAVSGAALAVSAYKIYADNPDVKKSIDSAARSARNLATGRRTKTKKTMTPTMRTPRKPVRRMK